MNKNYTIDKHFPQTIYYCDNVCSDILDSLEKEIKVIQKQYGTERSPMLYVDSARNTASKVLKNIPPFSILASEIKKHVFNYANELGYDISVGDLDIVNMWFNISGKGDFNFPHAHNNCDFAGVFYVKVTPENKIIFIHPQYMNGQIIPPDNFNLFSYDSITYTCKKSTIMVWRNYLLHSTPRQMNEGEKIVISFNVKIK